MGEVVLFAASSELGRRHKFESENSAWPKSVRVVSEMSVRGCTDFFCSHDLHQPSLSSRAFTNGPLSNCASTSLCVCEDKLALE